MFEWSGPALERTSTCAQQKSRPSHDAAPTPPAMC